jgi:hypothetical protein
LFTSSQVTAPNGEREREREEEKKKEEKKNLHLKYFSRLYGPMQQT